MSDRKKVGVRVDGSLWERFRQDVENRKGQTRGVLGDELENAIREYLHDESTPTERRIEKRIERIERAVGAAPTDGGLDTLDEPRHTHTPSRLQVDSKPSANAATEKKVAYLAECVLDKEVPNTREMTMVPRARIIEVVKDEYGFRSDTAQRYVDQLVEYFDLFEHPQNDSVLVSKEKRDELIEAEREQRAAETDADLDSISE